MINGACSQHDRLDIGLEDLLEIGDGLAIRRILHKNGNGAMVFVVSQRYDPFSPEKGSGDLVEKFLVGQTHPISP